MICDFHTHSNVSDGSLSPRELVESAGREGVQVLALTDHDDVSGVPIAREVGRGLGIEILSGVEISVSEDDGARQMHVLGLGFDPDHPALVDSLSRIRMRREARVREMLSRLADAGVELPAESLETCGAVGRPHVARALVAAGACTSIQDAFVRYLRRGRPGYVPSAGVPARTAIELIQAAGGIACLAHPPLSAGVDQPGGLETFVERLVRLGLDGLEVWHPGHRSSQTKKLRRLARQFDLVQTGGSDFHGDVKPDIRLGRGRGGLKVGSAVYRAICARIRTRAQSGD